MKIKRPKTLPYLWQIEMRMPRGKHWRPISLQFIRRKPALEWIKWMAWFNEVPAKEPAYRAVKVDRKVAQ